VTRRSRGWIDDDDGWHGLVEEEEEGVMQVHVYCVLLMSAQPTRNTRRRLHTS
jgi:hypothetical protein